MTNRIATVLARQLWDSRGRPTVEAEVRLENGAIGRAIAPAGASRGAHEAIDLRDGGDSFGGMGVAKAVANVAAEIAPALAGMDARDQAAIDRTLVALDGTPNKARLGGNAVVAVSMAVLHAAAAAERAPLWRYLAGGRKVRVPLPEIQIFGGGAHAGRRTDIQDFMVMAPRAGSFRRALEITDDVYRAAGKLMEALGPLSGVADEGGWWPNFSSNEQALDTLTRAIERAGHRPGEDVFISLDIAANELGDASGYRLALDDRKLDGAAMAEEAIGWTKRYPILSIEDPASQDDFATMAAVTRAVGDHVQVIGQPDYSGCEGGEGALYSSAVVMRGQEGVRTPADGRPLIPVDLLRGKRFAFNSTDSMSGFLALTEDLEDMGEGLSLFSGRIVSGGHRASVRAVAERRADVAAVDCRSWAMARRHEPAAKELAVVGWTGRRKGLPYICAGNMPPQTVAALREAATETGMLARG